MPIEKLKVIALVEAGCPVCATWKPAVAELARKRSDLIVELVDVSVRKVPYDEAIKEVPMFRLEGPLEGCAPMVSAAKFSRPPKLEELERWIDRAGKGLLKGTCPRGAKVNEHGMPAGKR